MSVHRLHPEPRYGRRLSDRIFAAFTAACGEGDFQVAEQLLHVLAMTLSRPRLGNGYDRRTATTRLAAAYERLSRLRRVGAESDAPLPDATLDPSAPH
jgi:hypothetical protein